jgi:hypothetical protein
MRLSFRSRQLAFVLKSIPGRRNPFHILRAPRDLWDTYRNTAHLEREIATLRHDGLESTERCSVVLLSHNRPYNMDMIVKAAMQSGVVTDLVVSNSNRNVTISEWISSEDSRITLIDDRSPTRPGHRFTLAERMTSNCILAIDDDFFLTPKQWRELLRRLAALPSVPHGFRGNEYLPGTRSSNGSPFHHVQNISRETDVLIGAYAFTREHLGRMRILANEMGLGDLSQLANGEDILLSFCGHGRPRLHDLGKIFACASESLEGIALWKTHKNFWQERVDMYNRTKAAAMTCFPEHWTIEQPDKT